MRRDRRCDWIADDDDYVFLSGAEEPMHIHKHWIEPRPAVCCVPAGGDSAALELECCVLTERDTLPGAVLPLNMDGKAWGCGLAWNQCERQIEVARGGLYYAAWSVPVGSNGLWPVVICLETAGGQCLGSSANIGTMVAGSCLAMLSTGDKLCLVNRSGGVICLTELCSGPVKCGASIRLFKVNG